MAGRFAGVSARRAGVLLLALLAGCEHAQPFGAADLGPNAPLSTAFPRQLTFSAGGDLAPVWLPDGSGILYSFQDLGRADHDRCLAILPAEGGRQTRVICHRPVNDEDSTNALWSPAVGPGGVIAYVRESSAPGAIAPSSRELVVASLTAPDPGRVVLRFPLRASDGTLQGTAAYIRWADADTLIYLAEGVRYQVLTTPPDTAISPIELMRLVLKGDSASVTPLPGTSGATSATVVGGDTVYFTLAQDSVVYALPLAGGTRSVVHDFHALGAVGDVQRQGNRLFVVSGYGEARGSGGHVYMLDLAADSLTPLDDVPPEPLPEYWYRSAALSPAGTRVAAEGYRAVTVAQCFGDSCRIVDTVSTPPAKLWLLRAP